MKKISRIATIAVSVVMASTMVASMASGCKKKTTNSGSKVTVNLAVGYNSARTSTTFNGLGATIKLPDGKQYTDTNFKPAWVQLQKDVDVTLVDKYTGDATSKNLGNRINGDKDIKMSDVDIITTDLDVAVTNQAKLLNLGDYLDKMPNFRAYLEANPIVYLSLLQDGMQASGTGKKIYIAPYFDGNDTIEKYALARRDWVEKILNGRAAVPAGEVIEDGTYGKVQPYFTQNYSIESLTADGSAKQTITKDYDAAKAALSGSSTNSFATAYAAINDTPYAGQTGNIVEIMNEALRGQEGVTGDKLINLYREYIDVAYKVSGAPAYSVDKRADLFGGYSAAWDVDDLVAILRIIKSNSTYLTGAAGQTVGLFSRSADYDRTQDMTRMIGDLYGVRGADSRFEYTYIDNAGNLKDARNGSAIYEAMERAHALYEEGLIRDSYTSATKSAIGTDATLQGFMMYDYSQTQTLNGFYPENPDIPQKYTMPEGYDFGPVINPVSKWDVNGDSSIDESEIFRFTESWRSVKSSGMCISADVKKNSKKLEKVLEIIDYIYSNDGRIVMTYGPMAENADGKNGFWYNEEATPTQVAAGEYFEYKGKKYSGTYYEGRYTPTITKALYDNFTGKVNNLGWETGDYKNSALSFTNYARQLIGSTLPVGIKDQSFENQLTSKMGVKGAGIVGKAIAQGVIKHPTLSIDTNNYWYTIVPTSLPMKASLTSVVSDSSQNKLKYITGTMKDKKTFYSLFNYIVTNGATGTYNQQDESYTLDGVANLVTAMNTKTSEGGLGCVTRANAYGMAWETCKNYIGYLNLAK